MTHLDEKTLELYVLDAKEVSTQRSEIEDHLKECAGCKALHQEISDYYAEVQALQREAATANTQALTLRDWIVHARRFEDRAPLKPVKQSLALRAVVLAVRHPVISSASFLALLAAALLLSYPRKGLTDLNPSYARAKDEFLIVYNTGGDELWRKHIGAGYDSEKLRITPPGATPPGYEPDMYLVTTDVDGDGKNKVIAAFGLFGASSSWPMRNAVVCYNADGNDRWVTKLGRQITFGTETFTDAYAVRQILVTNPDKDGARHVLALAGHEPYYPSVIVSMEASTGRVLNEYWHSGHLHALHCQEIGGDGASDLLAIGENNAYDMAALTVLDLRALSGHSPALPAYTPQDVPVGTEKYYLLFPRSDVKKVASHKRNVTRTAEAQPDGLLQVWVAERVDMEWYPLIYSFGASMKCVRVEADDRYIILHRKLETEGKLTQKLDAQYYEKLRQGVLYWDGEKFVKHPAMNRRYLEVVQK